MFPILLYSCSRFYCIAVPIFTAFLLPDYICPTGWHLPSDAEWQELSDYLFGETEPIGGGTDVGGKLKEPGTTHWKSPNLGATNETGLQPFRVATVSMMAHSTILAPTVTGGVLRGAVPQLHGAVACTTIPTL